MGIPHDFGDPKPGPQNDPGIISLQRPGEKIEKRLLRLVGYTLALEDQKQLVAQVEKQQISRNWENYGTSLRRWRRVTIMFLGFPIIMGIPWGYLLLFVDGK